MGPQTCEKVSEACRIKYTAHNKMQELSSPTETQNRGHKEDIEIESFHGRKRVKDLDAGWAWMALLAGFISMVS